MSYLLDEDMHKQYDIYLLSCCICRTSFFAMLDNISQNSLWNSDIFSYVLPDGIKFSSLSGLPSSEKYSIANLATSYSLAFILSSCTTFESTLRNCSYSYSVAFPDL